jgi:hypothetical protein
MNKLIELEEKEKWEKFFSRFKEMKQKRGNIFEKTHVWLLVFTSI